MGLLSNAKPGAAKPAFSEEQWNAFLSSQELLKTRIEELASEITDSKASSKEKSETDKTVSWLKKEMTELQQRAERIERLLEMHSYGVTEEKRPQQIIVTLTSYGKRIGTVPRCLERLMNQTLKPDRIILYLSVLNFPDREAGLPLRLLEMKRQGLEIRWCEGDQKSFKKLLPALKDFPEDILITVDDDLYVDLNMIERLYQNHRLHPEAVIASRAHKMVFDEDGKLLAYENWEKSVSSPEMIPGFDLLPTTGAGTLFPPGCFPEEVFNEKAIWECCPDADDLWVKTMLTLKGAPVLQPDKRYPLRMIEGTQDESLWAVNMNGNDIQLRALLDRYKKGESDKDFFCKTKETVSC